MKFLTNALLALCAQNVVDEKSWDGNETYSCCPEGGNSPLKKGKFCNCRRFSLRTPREHRDPCETGVLPVTGRLRETLGSRVTARDPRSPATAQERPQPCGATPNTGIVYVQIFMYFCLLCHQCTCSFTVNDPLLKPLLSAVRTVKEHLLKLYLERVNSRNPI
jgi:hypothetical protein